MVPANVACPVRRGMRGVARGPRQQAKRSGLSLLACHQSARIRLHNPTPILDRRSPRMLTAFLAAALTLSFDGPPPSSFVLPTNSFQFQSYLAGQWSCKKVARYTQGGLSGRFEGTASFTALGAEVAPRLLAYSERGIFTPDEAASFSEAETRNALLYDFRDWQRCDVLFDAAQDRSSAQSILAGGQLLYSLVPSEEGTMRSEDPATGPQDVTYSGVVEVSAEDAFLSTWYIEGAQQGNILSLFRRLV